MTRIYFYKERPRAWVLWPPVIIFLHTALASLTLFKFIHLTKISKFEKCFFCKNHSSYVSQTNSCKKDQQPTIHLKELSVRQTIYCYRRWYQGGRQTRAGGDYATCVVSATRRKCDVGRCVCSLFRRRVTNVFRNLGTALFRFLVIVLGY